MNFFSEYGEDFFLYERYPEFFNKPAFYVDCGCGHPQIGSNTAFLRELGWSGLHIDADRSWEALWGGNFIHACLHTQAQVRFDCHPVPQLSRVVEGEPNVSCRRLDDILKEHGVDEIGLLSIDCEGQEYEVFQSMISRDYQKLPTFIIAEYNTHGIGEDFRLRDYLTQCGYEVIHQTVANFIYARCSPNGD